MVLLTRKLSYRKGDRAMCPVYRCPEKLRDSTSMLTANFPEIFNGLCYIFAPIDPMNVRKKFARSS